MPIDFLIHVCSMIPFSPPLKVSSLYCQRFPLLYRYCYRDRILTTRLNPGHPISPSPSREESRLEGRSDSISLSMEKLGPSSRVKSPLHREQALAPRSRPFDRRSGRFRSVRMSWSPVLHSRPFTPQNELRSPSGADPLCMVVAGLVHGLTPIVGYRLGGLASCWSACPAYFPPSAGQERTGEYSCSENAS